MLVRNQRDHPVVETWTDSESQVIFQAKPQVQNISIELLLRSPCSNNSRPPTCSSNSNNSHTCSNSRWTFCGKLKKWWLMSRAVESGWFWECCDDFSVDLGPIWPVTATKTLPKSAQDNRRNPNIRRVGNVSLQILSWYNARILSTLLALFPT